MTEAFRGPTIYSEDLQRAAAMFGESAQRLGDQIRAMGEAFEEQRREAREQELASGNRRERRARRAQERRKGRK